MYQQQAIEYNTIQQWNANIRSMKKDYGDTFIKTHLKVLKVTTPNTVFLKWTEFEWWMDLC